MEIELDTPLAAAATSRRRARTTNSIADKDRRAFLRLAMAQGVAAPVALAALERPAAASAPAPAHRSMAPRKGAMRLHSAEHPTLHAAGAIVRDFADPQLELLRLLREAAEIEHALMLQYLFCAFSLRERYADLAGYGTPDAETVLGVAIQEMQHLSAVNHLLVALGSCPHLDRQDFPYEPDIYPFCFHLEAASRASLAKFVYCEAPADMFDLSVGMGAEDERFRRRIVEALGGRERVNHVGSLYRAVLDMLDEAAAAPDGAISPDDAAPWREKLIWIMDEGEEDHFRFFRSAFEARHPAFAGVGDAWSLAPDDPLYPAHTLPANPTAYIGHPEQIADAPALVLAWLGNLHYWLTLSCLDLGYRSGDAEAVDLARMQMMSALWPLATELPRLGAGMPFDPLSMGYALGAGQRESRRIIVSFAREAQCFARSVEHRLPSTYDTGATGELIAWMSA